MSLKMSANETEKGITSELKDEDSFSNFKTDHWNNFLLLQFQIQFRILIWFGSYVSFSSSLMDMTFAFSSKEEQIPHVYSATLMGVIYLLDTVYFADALLMSSLKNVDWPEIKQVHPERSALCLTIDFLSVIPSDGIYYSLAKVNMRTMYTLRLRYALRIYRIFYTFRRMNSKVGYNRLTYSFVEFLIVLSTIVHTTTCISYYMMCEASCMPFDYKTFLMKLFVRTGLITSRSYPELPPDSIADVVWTTLTNFLAYLFISGYTIASFTSAINATQGDQTLCKHKEALVKRRVQQAQSDDPAILKTVENYFKLLWSKRRGAISNTFFEIIPEIMVKEIKLDITWTALKHSHLFRDQDVHFLRYVSLFVKQRFMQPGEVVCRRNRLKSGMVYVASGVIQVLASEDSETPILSFSEGTCFGESTLFVDYPSPYTVVCHSYCELYMLTRKEFVNIYKKYPEVYRSLRKQILKRYTYAHECVKFNHFHNRFINRFLKNRPNSYEKTTIMTSKWIKMTWEKLLLKDEKALKDYETKQPLKDRLLSATFDKIVFCPDYLDLFVIARDIELFMDKVLLRTKFPIVFQPDSIVITLWRKYISILALAFSIFYPYYAAFDPTISTTYSITVYFVTIAWLLDLYVSASTAITSRDVSATEIRDIIYTKLATVDFLIDILAVIPAEILYLIFTGKMEPQVYILFQVNRTFKIKKMYTVLKEMATASYSLSRTYFNYILWAGLLIYYSAAVLYINMYDDDDLFKQRISEISGDSIMAHLLFSMYYTCQKVTGYTLKITEENVTEVSLEPFFVFFMILDTICVLYYIYTVADLASKVCLRNHTKLILQELVLELYTVMDDLKVSLWLQHQVSKQLSTEAIYNGGATLLTNLGRSELPLPVPLFKKVFFTSRKDFVEQIPLFQGLSDVLIAALCSVAKTSVVGPGSVIMYSGEVCKEMYVITQGYCKTFSSLNVVKVISVGASFGVVETCIQLPIVNTVTTLTYCNLLSISYEDFTRTFSSYPYANAELNQALKDTAASDLTRFKSNQNRIEVTEDLGKFYNVNSFKNFGYRLVEDTPQYNDYYDNFTKYGCFEILRYILLRHTITPYGRFLMYWEIARSIFAFVTNFLIFIPHSAANYLLVVLDVTAWIDIYVRHHITYFNEDNIEISHPLKTAIYYWKHAFLMDLLAAFPFNIFAYLYYRETLSNRAYIVCKLNRLLQIYRILGVTRRLEKDSMTPLTNLNSIRFLPVLLILINVVGSAVTHTNCEFSDEIQASETFMEHVNCDSKSWLAQSMFDKPFNAIRTYFYGMYFATNAITSASLGGYAVQTTNEAIGIIIASLAGYAFFIFITSKTAAFKLVQNADLTSYQKKMNNLVKFLSYRRIDPKLKNEVIEHFEFKWRKTKGKNIRDLIYGFHYALQEDIMYDIYGSAMAGSSLFQNANKAFLRNVLLHFKHEVYLKRGIIYKVNDIHGTIYFVYKGQVEVVGPDHNKLLVLPVGSLFGNLDDCEMSRQTLTMVAKGHVEVLSIASTIFHKILKNYRQTYIDYHKLIRINIFYLVDNQHTKLGDAPKTAREESCEIARKGRFLKIPKFLTKVRKPSKTLHTWDIFFLVVVCIAGFSLEIYQKSVLEYSPKLIFTLYLLDILFVFNIYLKFHRAYEDEYGLLVTDKRLIARRYIHAPLGFAYDIISVFPFEIISLFFLGQPYFGKVWQYLRCNRIIRVISINDYFQKKQQTLNIRVYALKISYISICIFYVLQVLSAIGTILACSGADSGCDFERMDSLTKLFTYMRHIYVVVHAFTGTSTRSYYPDSYILILLTSLLLIALRYMSLIFIAETCASLQIARNDQIKYDNQIKHLKHHMKRENASMPLLNRVWTYVQLLWEGKDGVQFPQLLEEAPYYLREAVLNSMFGYHIDTHPVLRHCHLDLIRQMAAQLRTRTFFAGDYIVFMNDMDECMYFIDEGSVDVLSEETLEHERISKTLNKGDMFGLEQGMYLQCKHDYTYRANRYSVILVLERSHWIRLLRFFPASKVLIYDKNRDGERF